MTEMSSLSHGGAYPSSDEAQTSSPGVRDGAGRAAGNPLIHFPEPGFPLRVTLCSHKAHPEAPSCSVSASGGYVLLDAMHVTDHVVWYQTMISAMTLVIRRWTDVVQKLQVFTHSTQCHYGRRVNVCCENPICNVGRGALCLSADHTRAKYHTACCG